MPILVLGMHRSGTSAATRLVGYAGLPLDATTDLMPAAPSNPKGHWESEGLAQFNDRLLAALNGDWSAPPRPRPAHELIAALHPWRAVAMAAFERALPTGEWVWKDPRNCLLAPFWLDLLTDAPAVVLMTRDPLEVAWSLRRRDGFSLHHGLALWEHYNRSMLEATAGRPAFVSRYEDLLSDPVLWVQRVRDFLLSLGSRLQASAEPGLITAFVDRSLHHTAADDQDAPVLSREQQAMQQVLTDAVGVHAALPALPLPHRTESGEALLEARRSASGGQACAVLPGVAAPVPTPVVILARADFEEVTACLGRLPAESPGIVVADNPGLVQGPAAARGFEVLPALPSSGPATVLPLSVADTVAVLPSWAAVNAEMLAAADALLHADASVGAVLLSSPASVPVPLDATTGGWPTVPCVLRRAALGRRGLGELARSARAGLTLSAALRGWVIVDASHMPGYRLHPQPPPPLLTVVEIATDGLGETERRLRRLSPVIGAARAEVVVVDDGTRDGTSLLLACLEGDVRIVRNAVAMGAAAGTRLAAASARAPFVCIIGDAVPPEDELALAVARLHDDQSLAVVTADGWTVARRDEPLMLLQGWEAGAEGAALRLGHASAASGSGGLAVSIIIPLFNKAEYTERCLQSIVEHTPEGTYEVVLVDNASTDGTALLLQALEGDVQVITNPVNRGYAVACNQGAAAARGRHLLFLNNDTEVAHGWLPPLLRAFEDPEVGAVGARLLFPDGTIQHAGVELVLDQREGRLAGVHRLYRQAADHPDAVQATDVEVVTGALMLVRRDAFSGAGGFDERYWNGNEDVDLCLSMRALDWRIRYEPDCCIVHHESVSGPERFSGTPENEALLTARWTSRVAPHWIVDVDGGVHRVALGAAIA